MAPRKERGPDRGSNVTTIAAGLIASVTALIVAYWQFVRKPEHRERPPIVVARRVIDAGTTEPIRGARVLIYAGGVPISKRTDSEGVFAFEIREETTLLRLLVEATGYDRYDRRLDRRAALELDDIELSKSLAGGNDDDEDETPPASSRPGSAVTQKFFVGVVDGAELLVSMRSDTPQNVHAEVSVDVDQGPDERWLWSELENKTKGLIIRSPRAYAIRVRVQLAGSNRAELRFDARIRNPDGSPHGTPFTLTAKGPSATHSLLIAITSKQR
jgi:hypothetical protein